MVYICMLFEYIYKYNQGYFVTMVTLKLTRLIYMSTSKSIIADLYLSILVLVVS
jgi:hypothetical protein